MKKAVSVVASVLTLFVLSIAGAMRVNVATANFVVDLPSIVIQSDGSVVPETEYINHTGNVYTLTGNISQKYAIVIHCSNITLDGAGCAITAAGYSINVTDTSRSGFSRTGISLENVNNVTVKNVQVSGFWGEDIALQGCVNCSIHRVKVDLFALGNGGEGSDSITIAESEIRCLQIKDSNNNLIIRNNITGSFRIQESNSNTFFENNFLCKSAGYGFEMIGSIVAFWDNGTIGNYWSDYSTKYPNTTEIGCTGIGDIPYIIDANNIDNYPLMTPSIVQPSPEPQPEEPFLVIFAAVVSGVALTAAAACMVYYRNKRNH